MIRREINIITGEEKIIDIEGRVDRFKSKFAKAEEYKAERAKKLAKKTDKTKKISKKTTPKTDK